LLVVNSFYFRGLTMKAKYLFSSLVLAASLACCGSLLADPFDLLAPRFSGTFQGLHSVTFGNGVYVAVGENGTILSSADSVTWVPEFSGVTNRLNGIKYGTNGFVAVGDASTVLRSMDGITWKQMTSPAGVNLSAVTYGWGRYVAVGASGVIVTSTNGVNWASIDTGAPYNFNGVDFTQFNTQFPQNLFVLVGDSGTIMTSPDGLAWTLRFSGTFSRLNAISIHCQNFNTYNMTAAGDSGTVLTSKDGITWTVVTSGTSSNLLAVANDGNSSSPARFGIVGQGGVFITGEGAVWNSQYNSIVTNLNGVVYAHGNFVAVGNVGLIQAAILWLPRNSGTLQSLNAITFGGGYFMTAGVNVILRSPNGKDWSPVYTGTGVTLNGLAYGTNGYVAVGAPGAILTSSNGMSWSSQNIGPTTNTFYSAAFGSGIYVAINGRFAYRSTDGINWTGPYSLNVPAPEQCRAVGCGTNLFVALGQLGTIATSPDGINWTARNSGISGYSLNSFAYGNGIYLAVASLHYSFSPDGTNWTAGGFNGNGASYVAYGDQGFVVANSSLPVQSLLTTPDGTNWTVRAFDAAIGAIAFGAGTYVIAGGSMISQSVLTNSQAAPLLAGRCVSQGFKLSAVAEPNYTYRIQFCTNLILANWVDKFDFASTQAITLFIDTNTLSSSGFYQIVTP
jgi:hypothetical protein